MKKLERLNNESLVKKNLGVELISESANVKDFGAAGDGVTDDTQAFKLAIENALSTNKKLHIPSGRYYLATVHQKDLNVGHIKQIEFQEHIH